MKISIEITKSPSNGTSAMVSLASGMLAGAATSLLTSFLSRDRGHDEAYDDCDGKGARKPPFDISIGMPPKDESTVSASEGLMSTITSVLSSLGPILAASMAKPSAPTAPKPSETMQFRKCPWCNGDAVAIDDLHLVAKLTYGPFACTTCGKPIRVGGNMDDPLFVDFAKVEDEPAPAKEGT